MALKAFNDDYLNKITNKTSSNENGLSSMSVDSTLAQNVVTAYSNLNNYLNDAIKNKETHNTPAPSIQTAVKMRKDLKSKIDILNSMNGAPKDYNTVSNIYDDYRARYNNMIYVTIAVSLLVVVFLYIYFKLI